ncbi:hypothetical protein MZM54_01775 [[Brevibacterium] frigoritolerans]|nr:hypothetical protein [Peribacillus frigoritolerans]
MSFLIVILVILWALILLNKKAGKISVVFPKTREEDDELIELPDEKAYYDDTNQAIIGLKKIIDNNGIRQEDIEEISKLKKRISDGYDNWELVQKELERMIVERTSFITQGNFYPTEYAFDINRMRTQMEKARDYQLNNPLKALNKAHEFIKEQNEKVEVYKEIKSKTDELLPRLERYEKKLKTKKDQVAYFEKKQQLFIHLQKGELKEAKQLIKEFKSKVKDV